MTTLSFGMPSLLEAGGLEDNAALCRQLGLRFVELNMNLPDYQCGMLTAQQLCETGRKYGVFFTFHLDEQLDPCSFNPLAARAYRQTAVQTLLLAQAAGSPVVTMHMAQGVYFTLPDKKAYLYEQYFARYQQGLLAFRQAVEQAARGENGPLLCIENTNWANAPFIRKGVAFLLQSNRFALTLDTGHSWAANRADEGFMLRTGRLRHMHLHDAQNRRDHLPLGSGALTKGEYLNLAGQYHCRIVLETKTIAGLTQSVQWLRQNGYLAL